MLILSRRVGETLVIGSEISVVVMGVNGNQVRVGITAPADVEVHRQEVFERIYGKAPCQSRHSGARHRSR